MSKRSPAPDLTSARLTQRVGVDPHQISEIDAAHIWHPYSTIGAEAMAPVVATGPTARG